MIKRLWMLTKSTVSLCLKHRVTGLASEAGFFALLSLPPIILGLVSGIGFLGQGLNPATVARMQRELATVASRVFNQDVIDDVIVPTIDDVLTRGRLELVSLAFLFSFWSGSRVLNVFIDVISIMYGQGGKRGIVRARALSLLLYLIVVIFGAITLPLTVVGPEVLADILPTGADFLLWLYWPLVILGTIASVASLYHIATPLRSSWRRDLPGAVLAMLIWLMVSFILRAIIGASAGGPAIYGPLAASITVLTWLYFVSLAVLIGAALNAASHSIWPISTPSRSPLARWGRNSAAQVHGRDA